MTVLLFFLAKTWKNESLFDEFRLLDWNRFGILNDWLIVCGQRLMCETYDEALHENDRIYLVYNRKWKMIEYNVRMHWRIVFTKFGIVLTFSAQMVRKRNEDRAKA